MPTIVSFTHSLPVERLNANEPQMKANRHMPKLAALDAVSFAMQKNP
jgi:hypothetical protein